MGCFFYSAEDGSYPTPLGLGVGQEKGQRLEGIREDEGLSDWCCLSNLIVV